MNKLTYIFSFFLLSISLYSCDLTQNIEVDLPEYESEIFVESYLQPGLPFSVVMTRTVGYFDDLQLIYVEDAVVSVTYNNQTDTLTPLELPLNTPGLELLLDTALINSFREFLGDAIYLYGSLTPVPTLYDSPFVLNVTTADGVQLSATTIIPRPVEFEDPVIRFNDEERALILTRFQDNADTKDYYRRILAVREQDIIENEDGTVDTVWVSDEEQDFIVDDELTNGEIQVFGTTFDYSRGDTLIQTIYSVTGDYADFITTRDAAIGASLSPFGQPARLKSNIEGGQGIFTGQSRSELVTIIE
ncbi:MAG: DUF4249 domain-containing protein [Bacteroidia bacterium]|nr:DUF4249 domain-containing protein [Bacteroidia bacterium]